MLEQSLAGEEKIYSIDIHLGLYKVEVSINNVELWSILVSKLMLV